VRRIIQTILLWTTRRFIWFVVIVAILATANWIRGELTAFRSLTNDHAALITGKEDIKRHFQETARESLNRVTQAAKASPEKLELRVGEIETEIQHKKAEQKKHGTISSLLSSSPLGSDYLEHLKLDVEIKILTQEKDYLTTLVAYLERAFNQAAAKRRLEDLRLAHVDAYAKLEKIAREVGRSDRNEFCQPSWKTRIPVIWTPYKELRAACTANAAAAANYKNQKEVVEVTRLIRPAAFALLPASTDEALSQIDRAITERVKRIDGSWVEKATGPVIQVLPTAALILLSLIFMPILIKAFFYFVIAPMAARRPPIKLLPRSGNLDGGSRTPPSDIGQTKVSSVSLSITVDEQSELLIHPDYLQSSSVEGTKETKWLLDWSYPMSSLASGMIALTRIRTDRRKTFVISSTRDPLSEVGVISVVEGSALVFQPHSLVGILQRKVRPVHISSAWRFNSLHAWLTLQFRYLIFHGPAQLIVKGCRGVRVEAPGTGRSINQAATLGFAANLNYATLRCETFGAYLMGRDALFNDYFTGTSGFYVYEEMPNPGRKYGIFGRGIEGVTDSLLKVFGI